MIPTPQSPGSISFSALNKICNVFGLATIVSGSNLFVQTLNPTATLSIPLADQCRRCVDDQQSNRADPTTHCDCESSIDHTLFLFIAHDHHVPTACPAQCDRGQGRCYLGQTADMCCNFYLQNSCTDECPSGLMNDSKSVCGEFLINLVMQKVMIVSYKYLSYMHTHTHSHAHTYIHTHTHTLTQYHA